MNLPRIEAICLIGNKNQKIYLNSKTKDLNENLKLEFACHCCLDVIEERIFNKNSNGEIIQQQQQQQISSYLGLLLIFENLQIFGLITSTKLKILLIINSGENKIKDLDILTILRSIHTCYLNFIGNPFLSLNEIKNSNLITSSKLNFGQSNSHIEIKSEKFDKRIKAIAGW